MMREHLEVINHRDAIDFLEGAVQKDEKLNEWTIKSIHRLVLKGMAMLKVKVDLKCT